jgi:hypothetical protein
MLSMAGTWAPTLSIFRIFDGPRDPLGGRIKLGVARPVSPIFHPAPLLTFNELPIASLVCLFFPDSCPPFMFVLVAGYLGTALTSTPYGR